MSLELLQEWTKIATDRWTRFFGIGLDFYLLRLFVFPYLSNDGNLLFSYSIELEIICNHILHNWLIIHFISLSDRSVRNPVLGCYSFMKETNTADPTSTFYPIEICDKQRRFPFICELRKFLFCYISKLLLPRHQWRIQKF